MTSKLNWGLLIAKSAAYFESLVASYKWFSIDYRVGFNFGPRLLDCSTNKSGNALYRKQKQNQWNHMLFYPSSIFDPGRLNGHVNKKLNGIEQRIHNLIAAFHLRRAKMFRKNSQDLTPSRKSSQDLSTSPTPSGQRRASVLMRKVSIQALAVNSVFR